MKRVLIEKQKDIEDLMDLLEKSRKEQGVTLDQLCEGDEKRNTPSRILNKKYKKTDLLRISQLASKLGYRIVLEKK